MFQIEGYFLIFQFYLSHYIAYFSKVHVKAQTAADGPDGPRSLYIVYHDDRQRVPADVV